MAISSCWLHSPEGHSLGTVHITKPFFPTQAKVLTAAFAHHSAPVLFCVEVFIGVSSCFCPRCSHSSARAASPLGCLSSRFSKSPAYTSRTLPRTCLHQMMFAPFPCQLCSDIGRTGVPCAFHPKVHPETSLALSGA